MKTPLTALGATLVSALALSIPVHAQQSDTGSRQAEPAALSRCLEYLDTLGQRMSDEGFWLAGYNRGYSMTVFGTRYPTGGTATGTPPADIAPGSAPPADARPGGVDDTSPWADVTWPRRPHYEIRTLFRAANVLAGNGNEEACLAVVNAVEQRYDEFTSQLRELGVEPDDITGWRQAQIASAVPVSEVDFPQRVDDLIGADVRNVEDEDLGDIEDVVLSPQNGGVEYVIVSRGGFLGIGSEEVAVPWEYVRVAPGLTTFVLPVDKAAMDQAPEVAQEELVDPDQTGTNQQDRVDTYWRDTITR